MYIMFSGNILQEPVGNFEKCAHLDCQLYYLCFVISYIDLSRQENVSYKVSETGLGYAVYGQVHIHFLSFFYLPVDVLVYRTSIENQLKKSVLFASFVFVLNQFLR